MIPQLLWASVRNSICIHGKFQRTDLKPGDIEARRLGSSWIPASDIRDFVAGLLGVGPRSGDWSASG